MDHRKRNELTLGRLRSIAAKYQTPMAFRESDPSAYVTACNMGVLAEITQHMTKRKSKPRHYWTRERVEAAAATCSSNSEFRTQHKGAYSKAQTSGYLYEIQRMIKEKATD